jgi:hypothetical protein
MVPKMEACLRAVRGGVPKATVIDGRVKHSLLLEVFTSDGIGTWSSSAEAGGGAMSDLTETTPSALATGTDWLDRYGRSLIGSSAARSGCWSAARAATSGTPTATRTSTCSAGSR